MARNGSGTYSLPSGNPVVTGTVISSTTHNNTMSDIASALTQSVSKDGQTAMTGNLPMGGFKVTGSAVGTAATDLATVSQIASSAGSYVSTVGGTADVITLTPSPAISAYSAGQKFSFIASGTNTTNVTVNVSSLGAKALTKFGTTALIAGDIVTGALVTIQYDGTQFQIDTVSIDFRSGDITYSGNNTFSGNVNLSGDVDVGGSDLNAGQLIACNAAATGVVGWAPGGHFFGLTLSNNGSDANNDIDIAAGECTDDTESYVMKLTSSITKQLDAAWAVGTNQGGLDTGSEASGTWYHLWLVMRPDTGVVDALFSTSATSPTMPTNYTVKRRLGAVRNDGSSNILAFSQNGDEFLWSDPPLDVNANDPGTSAVSRTLLVPSGVKVYAIVNWTLSNGSAGTSGLYVSSPDVTDEAPSASAAPLTTIFCNVTTSHSSQVVTRTNTSSQVRTRLSASAGTIDLLGATLGWIDSRGRQT